jgi:hypothetical protein
MISEPIYIARLEWRRPEEPFCRITDTEGHQYATNHAPWVSICREAHECLMPVRISWEDIGAVYRLVNWIDRGIDDQVWQAQTARTP